MSLSRGLRNLCINKLCSCFCLTFPFSALIQGAYRYSSVYSKKNSYNRFYLSISIIFILIVVAYFLISLILSYFLNPLWKSVYFVLVILIISEIFRPLFFFLANSNRERKSMALSTIFEYFVKIGFVSFFYTNDSIQLQKVLLGIF